MLSPILIYNRCVQKISNSRLCLRIWHLIGAASLLLLVASCASSPLDRPWVYADLRALDSQVAPTPATDILAVYTRTTDLSVDIRVDLLDINAGDKYTLKLALWDNRDFSQIPLVIDISSIGLVKTSGIRAGKPAIWPRVVQDDQLDTITVNLNRSFIGERYHLDVSTYTTDPVRLADEVHDVRSDGQPPVQRAPVLMAFWDTFPVTTPAQALRRWNGAHTGPNGDRHGFCRSWMAPGNLVFQWHCSILRILPAWLPWTSWAIFPSYRIYMLAACSSWRMWFMANRPV